MSQWGNYDLRTMTAEVQSAKPNAPALQIRSHINARIRKLVDSRPFWSSLLGRAVVSVPNAYTTGSATLTLGSTTVTGTSTFWPYNDAVNTVIPNGVTALGYTEVSPSSMTGIAAGSWLYIDGLAGPAQAEAVPVTDTTATTFIAKFSKMHNPGCSVWMSSLANMQLQMGMNYPIYTVRAFHSASECEIDMPWGGTALIDSSYQLIGLYYSIAPDFHDFVAVWDPVQATPLGYHKPAELVNLLDPQRQNTGDPQFFADLTPDDTGTMYYELYPHQTSARQLGVLYARSWPRLLRPTDRPPWFINPSVFMDGATADALRIKNIKPGSGDKDEFWNLDLAMQFEQKFQTGLAEAIYADQGKALEALQVYWQALVGPGGAAYYQSHLYPGEYEQLAGGF